MNLQQRRKTRCPGNFFSPRGVLLWAGLVMLAVSTGWAAQNGTLEADRPGLLIIAHGAPMPSWTQPVLDLEKKVVEAFGEDNPFAMVKVVFMEFAQPTVADGVNQLQDGGCTRIVAVPLLVGRSSHSHFDIPALLGIYSDPEVDASLEGEGADLLRPRVPITVTTTLSDSDVIPQILLKRVRALSQDPANEAVVVLAHGSEMMSSSWEKFLKRSVTYICGQTGISYGDWKSVGMGHNASGATQVVKEAAEQREHVIVVGAYIGSGVSRMLGGSSHGSQAGHPMMHGSMGQMPQMPGGEQDNEKAQTRRQGPPVNNYAGNHAGGHGPANAAGGPPQGMSGMMGQRSNPLEGVDVRLADKGLLPDVLVTQWIVEVSEKAVQSR